MKNQRSNFALFYAMKCTMSEDNRIDQKFSKIEPQSAPRTPYKNDFAKHERSELKKKTKFARMLIPEWLPTRPRTRLSTKSWRTTAFVYQSLVDKRVFVHQSLVDKCVFGRPKALLETICYGLGSQTGTNMEQEWSQHGVKNNITELNLIRRGSAM